MQTSIRQSIHVAVVTVGSLKLELAKTHRAIANGCFGARRDGLESKVRQLEAQIRAMGFNP